MDSQIENAVQLAMTSPDQGLKRQAIEFLDQVKASPDGWQVCIQILSRQSPADDVVRLYALDVVSAGVQRKAQEGDEQSLLYVRDALMNYIQRTCQPGSTVKDPYHIKNKIVQTLIYLFCGTYSTSWRNAFDDLLALSTNNPSPDSRYNEVGTEYLFKFMEHLSNEIAETALSRTPEQQRASQAIKDAIRERDAARLMETVTEMLHYAKETGKNSIIDGGLDVIGAWVYWVEISLVVTERFLSLIYGLIGNNNTFSQKALHVLYFVLSKKMKPMEKLQLIQVLQLEAIVNQVVSALDTEYPDEDIWENLSELLNVVGLDLVKIFDSDVNEAKAPAEAVLETFFNTMVRCFKNEYDEVSRPIIPFFTELLSFFRKEKKNNALPPQHAIMLPPILQAVIEKMKYADDTDWGHTDEDTEEAEFQELRKQLRVLQEHVVNIDQPLFLQVMSTLVTDTFRRFREGGQGIEWRDIELCLVEMYHMGEMAVKSTGMFVKGKPINEFAESLVMMMRELMITNVFSTIHPAIQIKYVELLVRYVTFFEVHPEYIGQALKDYITAIHSDHIRVRIRSWYLFHRFIKGTRNCVTDTDSIERLLDAISDLLVVKAQVVDADWSADASDDSRDDATFDSQLSLFEAVGYLASVRVVPAEKQVLYANTVMSPIFSDMETHLGPAKNGDKLSVMQIHHDIMALATLARGFSDWIPGSKSATKQPPKIVVDAFEKAAEGILVSLESLNSVGLIREAARSSFARLLGVMGPRILGFLPRWFEALSHTTNPSEIGMFLRLLVQVVHAFRNEIELVLTGIIPGLLGKVLLGLVAPITGTDDAIQITELKREYINFLLNVFNNDLADVFINGGNQPFLEEIIKSVDLYARDCSDPSSQKTALSLLTIMSQVWGPRLIPGMVEIGQSPPPVNSQAPKGPRTHRPFAGFDRIMMEQFSRLCWETLADESFRPKDAQGKQVLIEVASLQMVIYQSIGEEFVGYLRNIYFPQISMPQMRAEEYINALTSITDSKNFKQFFSQFVGQLRNAPD